MVVIIHAAPQQHISQVLPSFCFAPQKLQVARSFRLEVDADEPPSHHR